MKGRPPQKDKLLGISAHPQMKHRAIPAKNRPNNIFTTLSQNETRSFHEVHRVYKTKKRRYIYYRKANKIPTFFSSTPNPNHQYMIPLEAFNSSCYQLLVANPLTVAKIRAHYRIEEKKLVYDFATSREVPGFVSAKDAPLKDEDLVVHSFNKGEFSIDDLDLLDEQIRQYEIKENKKIETLEKNKMLFGVSVGDILNYRTIKGLAYGLTSSYIMQEGDCHRMNMSKDGKRIDFDMSLWPILYFYKESLGIVGQVIDWAARKPYDGQYAVTARDIVNFPILTDAKPFYWPTNKPPVIQEPYRSALATVLPLSDNAFEEKDNEVYKKLSTNPIFQYHKYKALLKFILMDEQLFSHIARLHIGEDVPAPAHGTTFVNLLTEHMGKRIKEFRDVLVTMPEFMEFLNRHGDKAFEKILVEIRQRNEELKPKIEKHFINEGNSTYSLDLLIREEDIRSRYQKIKEDTRIGNGKKVVMHQQPTIKADYKKSDQRPSSVPSKDEIRQKLNFNLSG